MPALDMSFPRLFRTYEVPANPSYDCTIWEAARATSAAPTFFKRIRIGHENLEEEFIDGGMGCNNPVAQVLDEAESFGPTQPVACIVSIGTGHPDAIGLPKPDAFQRMLPTNLITALRNISTDCEKVAEQFEKRFKNAPKFYFRFNVAKGLEKVSLAEWMKQTEVVTHTKAYLQQQVVSAKIDDLVQALLKRPAAVNTEELSA
jgi:predicted acylesterase/phospholipase RssA